MPSFFEGIKRMAQGKPVFQESDSAETSESATHGGVVEATESTLSEMPKVYIEETESRTNGSRMDTYCSIRNDSQTDVLIDKMRMLGDKREIDQTLRAGERKQFQVYSGEMPRGTSDHDAELQYRDMAGNYYKSRHDVRFAAHEDRFKVEKIPYENTSRI